MPYMNRTDRNQLMMCSIDSFVRPDSIARIIDAFVDNVDLSELGFFRCAPCYEGRPPYPDANMAKLLVYGSETGIRSSRKLKHACQVNMEAKWLMEGLEPDHRTISDFRKNNVGALTNLFHEFNKKLAAVIVMGFQSVDGSKFLANNAQKNNFTANSLDERIRRLDAHTKEYLRLLEETDAVEDELEMPQYLSKDELERKLKEALERLEKYRQYQRFMEENDLSQLSTVDFDAKLMKDRDGFSVAYNVQTAIDSETHLITDFKMTNSPTDHGQLYPTLEGIKASHPDEIIEAVADKGYNRPEDMLKCLENGIVPNVILPDGEDTYTLETEYEASECDPESKDPEELSKCLHAGVIPEAYKDAIESIEVKTKRAKVREGSACPNSPYGTEEEMRARAAEGFFVRDPERNIVYCPAGQTLRKKTIRKNGEIRYINKAACGNCPYRSRCFTGKGTYKEIDFNKDTLEKPSRLWNKDGSNDPTAAVNPTKITYEKKQIVQIVFRPNRNQMNERFNLSEHPFGTIKRAMNGGYFLLRTLRKVAGEFALLCLGYNLKRAKNLLGFDALMAAVSM